MIPHKCAECGDDTPDLVYAVRKHAVTGETCYVFFCGSCAATTIWSCDNCKVNLDVDWVKHVPDALCPVCGYDMGYFSDDDAEEEEDDDDDGEEYDCDFCKDRGCCECDDKCSYTGNWSKSCRCMHCDDEDVED